MRALEVIFTFVAQKAFASRFHFTASNAFFTRNQRADPKLGTCQWVHFHLEATSPSLLASPVYLKAERRPPTILSTVDSNPTTITRFCARVTAV